MAFLSRHPQARQALRQTIRKRPSGLVTDSSGKAKLEFEKKGNLLVSKTTLPAGEHYTIVVQVKPSADGKPKNFRIPLDLTTCKPCGNAEYACICDE